MKKLFLLYFFFFSVLFNAQTDYSDSWEDFYSYNNVKDFIKVDNIVYALADNAIFIYNTESQEIDKVSSVQGLSGETTSSIFYDTTFKRLVIGYENGLVEVVDENGTITISSDIVNFNQSGEKSINHISKLGNKLYLSTPFAIVVYDIEKLEFGDTYFIGNGSSEIRINKTTIFNGNIIAATEDGLFTADASNNALIDFNNWKQDFFGRNFTEINQFNNNLLVVENTKLYRVNGKTITEVRDFFQEVKGVKSSNSHLAIALYNIAIVLDSNLNNAFQFSTVTDFNYTLNTAFFEDNIVFLGSKEFGILTASQNQSNNYSEIHPEGPLSNDAFSIAARNNSLWVVYGGYDATYAPNFKRQGFSHYNGENWINTKYDPNFPVTDLNFISIDPNSDNRVFLSSFGSSSDVNSVSTGGLVEVENDAIKTFYNTRNSTIESSSLDPSIIRIRIGGTTFDNNGNLWIANIAVSEELKQFSSSGQWSSFDLSSITSNQIAIGLTEIIVDKSGTKWIGTRRNGVYAFNENGNRKKALTTSPNVGNLPDLNVRTVAVDESNRIWLGTKSGLSVYSNGSGVFDDNTPNARPIVINANEDGFGDRLLGDQTVNSIVVDGADNKWFGTDNGGVIYTNPSGQNTIANFSKQNSPLPSNRIVKIAVDTKTGKVYFSTDKGIVAYNSNVAPFGEVLADVYAYPNPALKNHKTVTIDGRNGTNLPKGTNVKILDVSGNLVYETNVVEGQELQGGKVVWDKTNLAGNKVASGVYIVLLTNDDASENAVTKIAIVN
mgnify:CR=1 FL=1